MDVFCRNCGVHIRRFFGHWWHARQVQTLGPVRCANAEPEDPPQGPQPA